MQAFLQLPLWARIILVALLLGFLAGLGLLIPVLSARVWMVLGGGVVGVILLLLLYAGLLRLFARRRAGFMVSALGKHNSGSSGISDAAQRAKLDDLRQTFEGGIQKFRNAGKDLYSLPWYVVVGEPGSGKTEAIRHSNVGFPPGLQDELQGTGGTINMNWWFTNQAVFLDTAGRLLFEDVVPGSSNEWQEFLRLLKKARPNCPINGMLLCIPSDTLIKDNPQDLENKARKLANQLNDIQRLLDIRFPVFVLVTKSDLVPGFREFFEGIHDPRMQHQMVGWANPRPLDEPFRPEELESLLNNYLSVLNRRRLGLIEDPNPVQIGGKRIDEVDTLFTYPSNLQDLFPRLKRYLETIFAAGEWSSRPLFLRGIYFTSSLQEGSALDEELANALDLPLDELPEGRVWEKERAYFLRDVCQEKVFKEDRLVTRATNAKKHLRQRQMMIFWSGVAGLLALAAFAFYGADSLRQSVGSQMEYWTFLEQEMSMEDSFVPAVIYEGRERGTYVNNAAGTVELESRMTSVEDYHKRLRELAEVEIEVPGVFRFLLLGSVDRESRLRAQRVAFEHYVVRPLLRYSRDKMMTMQAADWNGAATGALRALLLLERDERARNQGIPRDPLEPVEIINPLMLFLTGQPAGAGLPDILEQTYFGQSADLAGGQWPPVKTSGGDSMREYQALARGLDAYLGWARHRANEALEGLERISQAFPALQDLERAEMLLLEEIEGIKDARDWANAQRAHTFFEERFNEADRQIQVLAELFATGRRGELSLHQAYRNGVRLVLESFDRDLEMITGTFAGVAVEPGSRNAQIPVREGLFGEITARLEREREEFARRVTGILDESALEALRDFDNRYLDLQGFENRYSFRVRADFYRRTLIEFPVEFVIPDVRVGELQEKLGPALDFRAELNSEIGRYGGGLGQPMRAALRHALSFLSERELAAFTGRYRDGAVRALRRSLGFPLILEPDAEFMTVEQVVSLRERISEFERDLSSEAFAALDEESRERIATLRATTDAIQQQSLNFVTEAGNPRRATFSYLSEPHQREHLRTFYPNQAFESIFGGRSFRDLSFRGRDRIRAYQAAEVELAILSLNADSITLDFFELADSTAPDATLRTERPWAPLWFILNNRSIPAEPRPGDPFVKGQIWHVLQELPATGELPIAIVVTVRFSQSIPDRNRWSSTDDFPW